MATRAVDLCLACSSSLPPRRSSSSKPSDPNVFTTPCCNKPICPSCISKNSRLARYNPCLHCLGGVGIMNARSLSGSAKAVARPQNLDGGLHDSEIYAIGDDDDDEEDQEGKLGTVPGDNSPSTPATPPPAYTELDDPLSQGANTQTNTLQDNDKPPEQDEAHEASISAPSEYYIQPKDTLVGIALRFGVDGRLLCRLNNLPPSTLRTTPHLLHTRTVLKLPPTARSSASSTHPSGPVDPEYEAHRTRERAEKRFQTVTKETDWRIAKAYVALAENADPSPLLKEDTFKKVQQDSSVEGRAMDQYLDDEEWEVQQRREGRGVHIPPFPYTASSRTQKGKASEAASSSRWRWR